MFSFEPCLYNVFHVPGVFDRSIVLLTQPSTLKRNKFITAILVKAGSVKVDQGIIDSSRSEEKAKIAHNKWKEEFEKAIPSAIQDIRTGEPIFIRY